MDNELIAKLAFLIAVFLFELVVQVRANTSAMSDDHVKALRLRAGVIYAILLLLMYVVYKLDQSGHKNITRVLIGIPALLAVYVGVLLSLGMGAP
jgi:hypothetical protein